MSSDLIYVYCMSNRPTDFPETIKLRDLKTLVFRDFHVVGKYVSLEEFSEESFKRSLSDLEWLEINAREHIEVINALMTQNTVIPFNFGTIFHNEANLEKFITDYADSLIENFRLIQGMEEWSIKVYCDRKALSEQIDELSEETSALEKKIMNSSPGKAFFLKKKKSELIENEMDKICKTHGQNYYESLGKISTSSNLNNLHPNKYTGRKDRMILNASYLVNKTKVGDFMNIIDALRNRNRSSGFIIETTGPWPPFSFIQINENLK